VLLGTAVGKPPKPDKTSIWKQRAASTEGGFFIQMARRRAPYRSAKEVNMAQPKLATQPLPQIKPQDSDNPCSPWTEPFQATQADAQAQPERQSASTQTERPSDAETERPTRDALSTIFNGG
jgi:hypothetical protein